MFFAAAPPDEASARRRRRRTRRAGRRARARGHRGDASGFRGVGTSLVFVSVFFLFRLFFGRARDERLARFSRPFVWRSDHRSCRVVFTLKRREQRVRKRARRRLWRRLFTGAMTKGSFWSTSVTRLIFYTRARARRRPRRVVALRLAKILRSRGPILTPRP